MNNNNESLRFLDIRRKSGLKSHDVARAAGLPLATEYLAEIGGEVQASDAIQLCSAFSLLTGKLYSIEELRITIKKQRGHEEHNSHYEGFSQVNKILHP